jgi:hypothetical protein
MSDSDLEAWNEIIDRTFEKPDPKITLSCSSKDVNVTIEIIEEDVRIKISNKSVLIFQNEGKTCLVITSNHKNPTIKVNFKDKVLRFKGEVIITLTFLKCGGLALKFFSTKKVGHFDSPWSEMTFVPFEEDDTNEDLPRTSSSMKIGDVRGGP